MEHPMRRHASLFLIAVAANVSVAEAARLSTVGMSCAQAAATVASAGAIVLSTGQFTYDRFVAHTGSCMHNEVAKPVVAPTVDSPYCSIGYRCEQRMRRFDND
jgi:hypothetical protein